MRGRKIDNVARCLQDSFGETFFPNNGRDILDNELPSVGGERGVRQSHRDGHDIVRGRFWRPVDSVETTMRELLREGCVTVRLRGHLNVPSFFVRVLIHEADWGVVVQEGFEVMNKEITELLASVVGDVDGSTDFQNVDQGRGG